MIKCEKNSKKKMCKLVIRDIIYSFARVCLLCVIIGVSINNDWIFKSLHIGFSEFWDMFFVFGIVATFFVFHKIVSGEYSYSYIYKCDIEPFGVELKHLRVIK